MSAHEPALTELATRLVRTAEALALAARLPAEAFDGLAADAFRSRASRSAARAAQAAGLVASWAGEPPEQAPDPASEEGGERPAAVPPGAARGAAGGPCPRSSRRARLPEVTDETG